MSIFGSILNAIFGRDEPAATPKPAQPQAPAKAAPKPAAQPKKTVDVKVVLDKIKADKKVNLDWERSIVDLMKLVGLDSSLAARKQLARELHYTGDTKDSASMNIWLHKQVMTKLAENGGKIPAGFQT